MNNQHEGITGRIKNAWEATADKRKAIADEPRKPLPDFRISRADLIKKGVPLTSVGVWTAAQVLKNPLGFLRLLSPKRVEASEEDQNKLEAKTISEGILGVAFTLNNETNLRAEPATTVPEGNGNRNIDVVTQLQQHTQVIIKRSVPSINPSDNHEWYEVEAIVSDTGETVNGYLRRDTLDTNILQENLHYNQEIYDTYRIVLATDENVNDREQEALIEGIELFAGYLQDIGVDLYPATVFALTDFDQMIRMVVGYYRRDDLRTSEQDIREEYQNVNAMAQFGKTVFFNLGRHGGTSTNDIRRIVIHELTHTLQENLIGRALNVRGGTTNKSLERPYGPIILREGWSEMIGLELTQPNWRSVYAGTLSINAAPDELITSDDFLAYSATGGFSYGAFFCYFLEDRYPGKMIEFHQNMKVAFEDNRNFDWREVFIEAFGDTFENISQRFMDEKDTLMPETVEVAINTQVDSRYPDGARVTISRADATSFLVVDQNGRTQSLFGGSTVTYRGMASLEGLEGEYLILEDDYGRTVYMSVEVAESSGFADLLSAQEVASVPQG